MEYKLIVVDMDGTLLNSNHQVSEKNKRILKEAYNRGIKIAIATGRIFTSAKFYARLIGVDVPIIACNGALIKDYKEENVIYSNSMKKSNAIDIVRLAKENNLYFKFYDENNFYVEASNSRYTRYEEWNAKQPEEDRINIIKLDDVLDYLQTTNVDIMKMSIIDEDIKKLENIKKDIEKIKDITINKSWYNNIEVMNKGVSKGKAIEVMSDILGINKKEIIAFGDNYNDLSMKDYVGTFVAMENGEDHVKQQSDYITTSNDDDGIAEGIIKYVLS